MSSTIPQWHPLDLTNDPLPDYDAMRKRCPIAHSEALGWSVFRHADVLTILHDPAHFSNVVSHHLSVPNGMDPPQHTPFRRLIEPYFSAPAMLAFEPPLRRLVDTLLTNLPTRSSTPIEIIDTLARPFSLQVQCAFMGWPTTLLEPLGEWIQDNHQATLTGDKAQQRKVAARFDEHIREQLHARRHATAADTQHNAPDVTSRLLHETVDGRPLTDEELVSLIRNWTAGELGTITACVGILLDFLAEHPTIQQLLRQEPHHIPAAIDEILRLRAPLLSNRRRTTQPVSLAGQQLPAGERLTLLWASANRDETVFPEPDQFRLDRNPDNNLLYGAGLHVCPGAPLARMELRVLLAALLERYAHWTPAKPEKTYASYPTGGYSALWLDVA